MNKQRSVYVALGILTTTLGAGAVLLRREPAVSPEASVQAQRRPEDGSGANAALRPRPQSTFSAQRPHDDEAKIVAMDKGRLLVAPKGSGEAVASISDLDAILEHDDPDDDWTQRVREFASTAIPVEAGVTELKVDCAKTFCRVKIVKPLGSSVGWHEIDQALFGVATGEAIFSTEAKGDMGTAYLYFAEANNQLPLGSVENDPGADEDGV